MKVNLVTTRQIKHLERAKKIIVKIKKWINLQINSNEVAKLMKSDLTIVTQVLQQMRFFIWNLWLL